MWEAFRRWAPSYPGTAFGLIGQAADDVRGRVSHRHQRPTRWSLRTGGSGGRFDTRLHARKDHRGAPVVEPPDLIRRSPVGVGDAHDDANPAPVAEMGSFHDEPVTHMRDHDILPNLRR